MLKHGILDLFNYQEMAGTQLLRWLADDSGIWTAKYEDAD